MTKNRFFNILILFLLFLIGSGFSVSAQEKKKQLVIINSYNEVAPWPRKYINKVIQDISDRPDFNAVRVIHLNNSLIFNHEDYDNLVSMLFENYTGADPDYLVLVGAFAFNLKDKIKQVWGDVPMLLISQTEKVAPLEFYFTALNTSDTIMPPRMTPMESLRDDYNFSLVLTPNKHKETVDMMIQMYPDMNKIVFMADGLYINHHISYMLREYINLKYPNIDYEWLLAGEEGVMIPYLNNNDPNVGLLLSTWYYTAPGVSGLPLMSATDSFLINGAHRPVFGLRYAYLNYGIIGGYFCSPDEIYKNVHEAVLDLISGKDMRDVPFRIPTEAYPYINYPKMVSLEIPQDICPDNTKFVDKPITLWEEYGEYVVYVVGVLVFLLLVLLVWYLICKRNRVSRDYNSLVNSMPIGYMQTIVDLDKNGSVKSVHYGRQNKALKTMVEDHNLKSLKSEEYADIWQESIDALGSEEGPTGSIIKAPNEEVYLEFIVNPNKKSKENRMILDVYAIDVTDKMKVEQVLRDAAKKAVEADNMKSAFLANMSHEIRTPLNAIVGFANLLCKTVDPEKKKKFVEIIETNNHLLLKLIGDILDISKADSNRMVFNMYTIDINKLLQTIVSGVDITKKPDVKIDVKFGLDKCLITSDPYRITQVVNNLLTNAIKFTERGLITVGYELMPNNMLRFYVRDTGLGISQADMSKLFTRFTKLNSFIQGTGLGLSISKTIVEKLGGTMRAESAGRGKGSTFYFTIPYVLDETKDSYNQEYSADDETRFEALKKKTKAAANDFAGKNLAQDPSLPSYKHERKKIMVVEDNDSNSQLLQEMLADRFDIVTAKDGAESITIFARETPDLVLMDINLPIKDGYQATEEIRRLSKTVPIIAVTAYAQQSDRRKVMDSGFDGYLSKPVDENELFITIRRFL
ncbi:MAG: response regulator [Muribaculaceae bacterium]|nr:response regulator [Muribaculaceae bacterium]